MKCLIHDTMHNLEKSALEGTASLGIASGSSNLQCLKEEEVESTVSNWRSEWTEFTLFALLLAWGGLHEGTKKDDAFSGVDWHQWK